MTDGHKKDMNYWAVACLKANHTEWGQVDAVAEEVLGRQGLDLDRNKAYPVELNKSNL